MNDNEQLIDQSQLAEDVAKKIRYEFKDKFLVKPLDPVMVKKEFTKLPENKQAVTDENNIEAVDIAEDDVKTEIKEVEADYRKGVVLKVPYDYQKQMEDRLDIINADPGITIEEEILSLNLVCII